MVDREQVPVEMSKEEEEEGWAGVLLLALWFAASSCSQL